jgi:lipoprotein NlpD
MRATVLARVITSLVLCILAACGGNPRAPVEDREPSPQATEQAGAAHTVIQGDTLYSIAFRYGLDYRKVAAANSIQAPYTIYPGQRIRLEESVSVNASAAYPAPPGGAAPDPQPAAASEPAETIKPLEPVLRPTGPLPQAGPSEPATAPAPKPPPTPAPPVVGGKITRWLWPTSGPVTRGYSGSVHKGIDIGGNRGDPVVAVAAGTVVYAGTGIVGFGELLIVKHNEVYLSAYGHNDELLAAEGETVAAGQAIARKGSSGTDTVKLHFEIRKEGKPIDPQRLLPRR